MFITEARRRKEPRRKDFEREQKIPSFGVWIALADRRRIGNGG